MIQCNYQYDTFNFPTGELNLKLRIEEQKSKPANILFIYENELEIYELMALCFTLKQNKIKLDTLSIPYLPYSRQDRINSEGEFFSLKFFANIINSFGFEKVITQDCHSDVGIALINNCINIGQEEIFYPILYNFKDYVLVSPDGGALKKIYKLAKKVNKPVIECSKKRNVSNGEITGVIVHADNLKGLHCVIVDDICDGGRTFIEIAKELKNKGASKITLCVTHGFFTKGLKVFDNKIDEIYTSVTKVK